MLPVLKSILRRAVLALPTLFGVVVVSFILTRLLPGDPAVYFAGAAPTPEAIADIRKAMHLDRPLWEQFISYVINLLHGDLGRSLITGQPVIKDLAARMPATLELTGLSLLIALLVSIPLGILGSLRKGSMIDHLSRLRPLPSSPMTRRTSRWTTKTTGRAAPSWTRWPRRAG